MDQWLNKEQEEPSRGKENVHAAYHPYKAFCRFLEREARIACNPVMMQGLRMKKSTRKTGRGWKSNNYSKKKLFKAGTSATGSGEVKNSGVDSREERKPKALSCPLCKDPPDLDLCKQFLKMSLAERSHKSVIRVKALYLGCLK